MKRAQRLIQEWSIGPALMLFLHGQWVSACDDLDARRPRWIGAEEWRDGQPISEFSRVRPRALGSAARREAESQG